MRRNRRKPSQVGGMVILVGLVWLLSMVVWSVGQVVQWTPIGKWILRVVALLAALVFGFVACGIDWHTEAGLHPAGPFNSFVILDASQVDDLRREDGNDTEGRCAAVHARSVDCTGGMR